MAQLDRHLALRTFVMCMGLCPRAEQTIMQKLSPLFSTQARVQGKTLHSSD